MTILWIAIFIAALIIEGATAELIAIWFVPGALVSLVLSFFSVADWIQWAVFVATSAILLVLALTVFRRKILSKVKVTNTNADSLIGEIAIVSEEIKNIEAVGAVKIKGQVWTARMENDSDTAAIGERVVVVAISGVKLICKKQTP